MRGNNIARPGDSATPQEWYRNLPVITKYWLTSTLLLTFVVYFRMTTPMNFILSWELISKRFQIWRLITPSLYAGQFDFSYFFHVLMLYQNSVRYEQEPYNTGAGGTSADYLWAMLFAQICFLLLSPVFSLILTSEPMLFFVIYLTSRKNAEGMSSFFGLKFKTLYVPWINVAYRLLIGHSIVGAMIGIGVGHLYYFLVEILPVMHNMTLIKTPKFCLSIIESVSGRTQYVPPTASANVSGNSGRAASAQRNTYNWGTGRSLGRRDD